MSIIELPEFETEQDKVIFTPDQRLRVFISSTLEELAPERAAARRAVEALRLSPVWYESGARPHPPRSMYRAYLRQSHVFVGIYWERYGWVAPGMDISGLEDEYRLADGVPKLLYLKRPAPEQDPRLTHFLDQVRASGTVSYRVFATPDELERLLADDLALMLSESFEPTTRHPTTTAPVRPPGNIPLALTSLIGRDDAVAAVRQALERKRLVTLTGVGGVGKTRLAIEVASAVAAPDGAWLCELTPATDTATVAGIVASALGASQRPGCSIEESIVDRLRTKDMLIILDNCEQVLGAAGRLVERILQHCPAVRVLATSRQRLGIAGEQVWPVAPLPVAIPSSKVEEIANSDGVRLFVERATATQHDFALDASNASDVAEICSGLDGIPLAIELAAARVGAMAPAEILMLLDRRFRLLTGGRTTAAERQQTLCAAIAWSYSLLSSQEQACFARLGVFAGTFDTDAVRATTEISADAWAVQDIMSSLVAKSVVVVERGAAGSTRYRLFESLRQFAVDRLAESGELEGCRRRHARHYAEFAERAGPRLLGADELSWRDRLRAERGNLRAAVNWSLDADFEDGELAVRIAAALGAYSFFEAAGDLSSLVESVVEKAQLSRPALRAAVLGAAAFAAFQNHADVPRAGALAAAALRDGMPSASPAPAHAFATMIMVLTWTDRGREAAALCEAAIDTIDQLGVSANHRAMIRQAAAASAAVRGEMELAQSRAAEALELMRPTGMPSGLAVALWMSSVTAAHDAPGRALELAREAIAIIRSGASDAVLGHVLAIRAQLRATGGDLPGALADLRESVEVSADKGDRTMLAVAFDRAITVLGLAGRHEAVATLAGMCNQGSLAPVSSLPRPERCDRQAVIEQARDSLGREPFQRLYARGVAMTVDEITAYVLGVVACAENVRHDEPQEREVGR